MKDVEGNELQVGDEVAHALRISCRIKLRRKTVIAVEEDQARLEWTTKHRFWDATKGVISTEETVVKHTSWIYASRNVIKIEKVS